MGALACFCFLSVQRVSPSLPLPTTPLSLPPTTLQVTLLVLLSSDSLLLILSTLASTLAPLACWAVRGQAATTGLVPHTRVRMHTTWTSIAPMSTLRVSTVVATVSLFAASGGERGGVYLSPLALLIYIMRFRTDLFIVKNTTNSCSMSKVHLVVFFTINKSYKLEGLVEIGYIS